MKDAITIIKKNFKSTIFKRSELLKIGISQYDFKALTKRGDIEKICHGIYQLTNNDFSDSIKYRKALHRIKPPSCICLMSALEYYHLTDHIPNKTWVMVPMQKRSAYKDLKLFRTRNPKWDIGIVKEDGFEITNIERTIVDSLVSKKILGANIGINSLKRALKENKTTLKKVSDMAIQLKVFHRIKSTIEVFA